MCEYTVQLSRIPLQGIPPNPFNFHNEERQKIRTEIQRFLDQEIIEIADDNCSGEYISNIFTRPKSDGRIRIIVLYTGSYT